MKQDRRGGEWVQRVVVLLDSPRGASWPPVDLGFELESEGEAGGVGEFVAVEDPASSAARGVLFPFPSLGRCRASCSALRSRSSLGISRETISPEARPS